MTDHKHWADDFGMTIPNNGRSQFTETVTGRSSSGRKVFAEVALR